MTKLVLCGHLVWATSDLWVSGSEAQPQKSPVRLEEQVQRGLAWEPDVWVKPGNLMSGFGSQPVTSELPLPHLQPETDNTISVSPQEDAVSTGE